MLLNINSTVCLPLQSGKVLVTIIDAISDGDVIGNPSVVAFTAEGKIIPIDRDDLKFEGSSNLKELLEDTAYRVAAVLFARGIATASELETIRRGEGIQLVALNPAATKAGFMASAA